MLITIDSFKHYRMVRDGEWWCLYQFPEACPLMDECPSYKLEDGTVIANWHKDTEVQFITVQFKGQMKDLFPTDLFCGDDFLFELKYKEPRD